MAKGQWLRTRQFLQAAKRALEHEHPMTIRQLFYRLVSAAAIENTVGDYKRVSRLITDARERGEVPFEHIADRSRPSYPVNAFDDPAEYWEVVKRSYRKDYWKAQPNYVEIWTEKDAIIGSIENLAAELGVTVRGCRGFASATWAYNAAQLFYEIGKNKSILVYYLGDHDPSGRYIEKEVYERVQRYGSGEFKMWRLAIHAADIKRFELPPLRVKETDPRAVGFLHNYSGNCVELDALPPTELRRRIRTAVENVIDQDAWNRAVSTEKAERESIERVAKAWQNLPPIAAR